MPSRRRARRPSAKRPGVVDRGGEGVLGREPVVDREDRDAGVVGEQAAGAVVGVEVAEHPAAAVEVDEQRPAGPPGSRGEVEARRQRPAAAGNFCSAPLRPRSGSGAGGAATISRVEGAGLLWRRQVSSRVGPWAAPARASRGRRPRGSTVDSAAACRTADRRSRGRNPQAKRRKRHSRFGGSRGTSTVGSAYAKSADRHTVSCSRGGGKADRAVFKAVYPCPLRYAKEGEP